MISSVLSLAPPSPPLFPHLLAAMSGRPTTRIMPGAGAGSSAETMAAAPTMETVAATTSMAMMGEGSCIAAEGGGEGREHGRANLDPGCRRFHPLPSHVWPASLTLPLHRSHNNRHCASQCGCGGGDENEDRRRSALSAGAHERDIFQEDDRILGDVAEGDLSLKRYMGNSRL